MPKANKNKLANPGEEQFWFSISLAQWSLHRAFFSGDLKTIEFASVAREFGIEAIEYVNQFYKEEVHNSDSINEIKKRADDLGVKSLLIMCDGEGWVGDPVAERRLATVENHMKWLDMASKLGCHSIRVNASSSGRREEQARLAADGLHLLCEKADAFDLNVLVENHGGLSSDAGWLASVMQRCGHPRVGTLPDFGNFHLGDGKWYDIYQGVEELMPYARAVSAKTHAFNEQGDESKKDYLRLLQIVQNAGYRGWIGIEWEGSSLPERVGIEHTLRLLQRVRAELAETA